MPIRKFVSTLQRDKERVDTLENLSHVASLEMIISYGVKGGNSKHINENAKYLPQHLKKNLLRAAFYNANSNVISTVISIQDDAYDMSSQNKIKYPSSLLKKLRELSDDQMFTLWLALFDEKNERKMGVEIFNSKFSMLLMTYLKQRESVLEELFLNYNWFLKTDFLQLLCKMQTNLKELTVKASIGTESQLLDIITDSQLKLRLFAFQHTPLKGLKVDSIIAFLECQNQLEDLNVSHWIMSERPDTRQKLLDRIFSCCKALRRLRLHFCDLCDHPENLSIQADLKLFVDFSNYFCGQAFQLPKASKLYMKNLMLTEDLSLLKECKWTSQVVELDLKLRTTFGNLMQNEFCSLQKLLVKCLIPGGNNASLQLNMEVFPLKNLKEVSLFLYEETIDYKTFATIVTESKLLERFTLHLTNNNVIYGFAEENFRSCLDKMRGLPLKSLYLVCDTGRDPMPFDCLLKLIDKCNNLTHLTFNASPHQCQLFRNKGFNVTQLYNS